MGWNYALNWLTVLPLEIVSASITVDYWVWVMPGGEKYLVNGEEQVQNIGLNAAWVSLLLPQSCSDHDIPTLTVALMVQANGGP